MCAVCCGVLHANLVLSVNYRVNSIGYIMMLGYEVVSRDTVVSCVLVKE